MRHILVLSLIVQAIKGSGFHQTTSVRLSDGGVKLIDKLTPSDHLSTVDPSVLSKPYPEQVLFTVHSSPTKVPSIVKALHFTLLTTEGQELHLTLSKAQQVYRMTPKALFLLEPASQARPGDILFAVNSSHGDLVQANLVSLEELDLPTTQFVQVYSRTCTFIANSILVSCKNEDSDGLEPLLEPLYLLQRYILTRGPQYLSDFYHWGKEAFKATKRMLA